MGFKPVEKSATGGVLGVHATTDILSEVSRYIAQGRDSTRTFAQKSPDSYSDSWPTIVTYGEALREVKLHSVDELEWREFVDESLLDNDMFKSRDVLEWLGY